MVGYYFTFTAARRFDEFERSQVRTDVRRYKLLSEWIERFVPLLEEKREKRLAHAHTMGDMKRLLLAGLGAILVVYLFVGPLTDTPTSTHRSESGARACGYEVEKLVSDKALARDIAKGNAARLRHLRGLAVTLA